MSNLVTGEYQRRPDMVEKPRYCAIESVGDQASEVVHPDGKQSLINNTNRLKPFAIIEAQEPAVVFLPVHG